MWKLDALMGRFSLAVLDVNVSYNISRAKVICYFGFHHSENLSLLVVLFAWHQVLARLASAQEY